MINWKLHEGTICLMIFNKHYILNQMLISYGYEMQSNIISQYNE
jgi:hypothetical protein